MEVNTQRPLYCPRCRSALLPERDTPDICQHLIFHYFHGDLSEDLWYHVSPSFLDAYLKVLTEDEHYQEWVTSNYGPEDAPDLQLVQTKLLAGKECWEALKDVPFFESLAMSVCNPESTILFYSLREALEFSAHKDNCLRGKGNDIRGLTIKKDSY